MSITPMMEQYLKTKKEYEDCILFYRLGDFYEMFFDDAKVASEILGIVLTGKDCGLPERAPMCGIPYHAMEGYLSTLVEHGHKVAICEQVEDPKTAKGIVKREVVRIVTPGTNITGSYLKDDVNNYLLCVYYDMKDFALSSCDLSTGEFNTTILNGINRLSEEIERFSPKEVLCNELFEIAGYTKLNAFAERDLSPSILPGRYFNDEESKRVLKSQFKILDLQGMGIEQGELTLLSSGALLKYLQDTQKTDLSHIVRLTRYSTGDHMIIDNFTRRNLELLSTMRDKDKKGSLLWILDKTRTAMGARTLRSFIERPLNNENAIEERLTAVEELSSKYMDRDEIREYLGGVYDLERLLGRASLKTINPRDMLALKSSLFILKDIKTLLSSFDSALLKTINLDIDPLDDISELLDKSISDDAPLSIREGGIIKRGYDHDADELRDIQNGGKEWIASLEQEEKDKTGIKNLKIKYNKVFGYFIEVTNSYLDMVPVQWTRKQTLTGSERFITPELKEMEDKILGAQDRLYSLEYELFCDIRERIISVAETLLKTARAVAYADVLCSFSYVAYNNNYVRPEINHEGIINIQAGRHPVVERMMSEGEFIVNDTFLDQKENLIALITGPNMAGKSTYMRQVALITLMAHLGSFVPADKADISITDRIFTRVGASDDLASGQSTFMVEMTEVANILNNATSKSLIILDEIGRGTSTYDGLSIAWSIVEFLARDGNIFAKTMFATHYHELTYLSEELPNLKNYSIAVKENDDDIIFLRKIVEGAADRSYGIQVAGLAGVPKSVTERAKLILKNILESKGSEIEINKVQDRISSEKASSDDENELSGQLSLFGANDDSNRYDHSDIINEILSKEIYNMTPLETMKFLDKIQKKLRKR